MNIRIDLEERSYDVVIERGCLSKASKLLNLDRKVLIVTDDGVPEEYVNQVVKQAKDAVIVKLSQGESSKNMANLERILTKMLEEGFTRGDCVTAVGGGMVGDIAGFAASTYMRGIDFYNIPTTLLSQADSSIGGKTAVNLSRTKNIVGTFWQPRAVLIDVATLNTLPKEQISSGYAEIIKAGMIADAELFEMIENPTGAELFEIADNQSCSLIEEQLIRALLVKKNVVEADERESGLRRILNFGHTIGHGIESVTAMLHGHAVALGMLAMCSDEAKERLIKVLKSFGLPTSLTSDTNAIYKAALSDKKMRKGKVAAVWVDEPGSCKIVELSPDELMKRIEKL